MHQRSNSSSLSGPRHDTITMKMNDRVGSAVQRLAVTKKLEGKADISNADNDCDAYRERGGRLRDCIEIES